MKGIGAGDVRASDARKRRNPPASSEKGGQTSGRLVKAMPRRTRLAPELEIITPIQEVLQEVLQPIY